MTNRIPRLDTDGDFQVENANVDALVNFAASDTFSSYPIDTDTDTDHAASDHADGGTLELDVSDLSGGNGTVDTVPVSDGAAVTWATVDNAALTNDSVTITAGNGLSGGGTVALGSTTTLDAALDIEDGGTDVATAHGINFGNNLSVTDDGDSTVTVSAPASGADWTTTTVTSDVTASNDEEILADSSSAIVTVTLPSPTNSTRVRVMRIASANDVNVARNGTENINGNASDLTLSYLESVELVADGTDWWIV